MLSFTLRILGGLIMQSRWSGSIRQCCTFTRHNTLRLPRPPLSPCPVSTIKLHLEPESRKLTNTNTNTNTKTNNNTNINIDTGSCLDNQTTSRGRVKKANQYQACFLNSDSSVVLSSMACMDAYMLLQVEIPTLRCKKT